MNCPVFCAPNAFPCHFGPAASATEVNAKPLSATLIVVASSRIKAGTPQGAVPAAAIANMTADAETATNRSGPTLLPARSLQMPTTMRPSAPTNWEIPIRSPAGRSVPSLLADQPDHTECRKGELRKHQQCRDDVNAPQEPVRAIRVDRLDRGYLWAVLPAAGD